MLENSIGIGIGLKRELTVYSFADKKQFNAQPSRVTSQSNQPHIAMSDLQKFQIISNASFQFLSSK